MRIKYGIAAFFIASVALAGNAQAGSLMSATRALGSNPVVEEVRAPIAYQIFCMRNPMECVGSSRSIVYYSSDVMKQIARVNSKVNSSMQVASDKKVDRWTVNASSGDCEDFALTKRSQLVKMGIPAGALRIAVVMTEKGDGHAVLVVRTTRGDYVLDNRRPRILKRQFAGYRWERIATADPRRWVKA